MKIDRNIVVLLALLLGAGCGVISLRADDGTASADASPAPAPAPTPVADDSSAPSTNAPAPPPFHFGPSSLNLGIRPIAPGPVSPGTAPLSPKAATAVPAPAPAPASAPAPTTPVPADAPAPPPTPAPTPAPAPATISLPPLSFTPMLSLRPPSLAPPGSNTNAASLLAPPAPAPAVNFPYLAPPSPAASPETAHLVAAPSLQPPLSMSVDNSGTQNYHIHVGDILLVTMADESDFGTRTLVENSGTITLPYIKEIPVAGETLDEATADITQRLSKYYINPSITLSVAQYRTKQFVILGQVNAPGVYAFDPTQDSMTLMEAIAKAGGVTQSGDLGHVTVKRIVDGKEIVIPVNARDARALSRNQEGPAFPILPGDSIVITLFRNDINLLGQVRRPGIYTLPPLLDSIDLIEAIALAGGTTDEKDLGIVHIKRLIDGKETSLSIDAKDIGRDKAGANFPLYAGDTVIVEVTDNDFIVLGQVNRPGSYQIPAFHDSVDLIEAIAMAGGATRLADTSHVTIKRVVNGKTVVIKANAQKLARSTDDEHVDVLPGDRIVISERIF